jgi:hypothetical protein
VKPTFGIHRGKDVERLDEDQQRSFLEWLDQRIDEGDDGPKMPEFKRLALTLRRSLARIDDANQEVEAAEARDDGPMTNLARMPDRQVRLMLALLYLHDEAGIDPFPASGDRLSELSGLSKPSISTATMELVRDGFILNPTRGEFRVVHQSKETLLSRFSSSLFFTIRTTKEEEKKRESKVPYISRTDAIRQGCAILKAELDDITLRTARTKLRRLMSQGRTLEDFFAVVKCARAEYDNGEQFTPLLDIVFLLDPARFQARLAASKTFKPGAIRRAASEPLAPDRYQAWASTKLKKLKERGVE